MDSLTGTEEEPDDARVSVALDHDQLRLHLLDPSVIHRYHDSSLLWSSVPTFANSTDNKPQTQQQIQQREEVNSRHKVEWIPWKLVVSPSPQNDPQQGSAVPETNTKSPELSPVKVSTQPIDSTANPNNSNNNSKSKSSPSVETTNDPSTLQNYFPTDSYLDLRIRQNHAFCLDCLEKGRLAKDDNLAAITYYQQGLEVDPDHVALWIALAMAQARQGLYPQSLQSLDKALALEPHNGQASLVQDQIRQQFREHTETQHQAEKEQQQNKQKQQQRVPRALAALRDVQAERALDVENTNTGTEGYDMIADNFLPEEEDTRHRSKSGDYSSDDDDDDDESSRYRRRRRRKREERERKRAKKRRKDYRSKKRKKKKDKKRRRRRYDESDDDSISGSLEDNNHTSESDHDASRNRGKRRDGNSRDDYYDDDQRGRGTLSSISENGEEKASEESLANATEEMKDIRGENKDDTIVQQSGSQEERSSQSRNNRQHDSSNNGDKDDVSSLSSANSQSFRKRRRSRHYNNDDNDSMGSQSTVDSLELLRKPKRSRR